MTGLIDPPEIVGPRLKALRYALGFAKNQMGFAAKCGIEKRTWNNWERMIRIPSREEAAKIRHATGATHDFVFHGSVAGMPFELVAAIREAESAIAKAAPAIPKQRRASA